LLFCQKSVIGVTFDIFPMKLKNLRL